MAAMSRSLPAVLTAVALLALFALPRGSRAEDLNKPIPAPALDPASGAAKEVAVLAGGCFWGQQGVFEHVKGVTKVVAGYSGGAKETANYDDVLTEKTGHAESVQITFDPKLVSYGTLLRIFFSVAHDPTQLDRQGPDRGHSYRSAIFPQSPAQAETARAYIAQLGETHLFSGPIVTRVEAFKGFYPAEDYHQDFLAQNPTNGYIVHNDLPKIEGLKQVWPDYFRPDPVLLAAAN